MLGQGQERSNKVKKGLTRSRKV